MLKNTALIFGPGEHFGFQVAKKFGVEGFHIVLIGRNKSRLSDLCTRILKENISCTFLVANVSKPGLHELLLDATQDLPPISAVVFNIKAATRGNGLVLAPAELLDALAISVCGALAAIQASVPLLIPKGSIILTGGGYKDKPDPEKLSLSVSKGALHTLFVAMIEPLRERNVKISTVVIDGAVRESGPISPEKVAETFWEAYLADTGEAIYLTQDGSNIVPNPNSN